LREVFGSIFASQLRSAFEKWEGIDAATSAGKLQFHIFVALAEFERERVLAGLARAKAQGVRLGRPPRSPINPDRLATVAGLPTREAARRLGVPRSTLQRLLAHKPAEITR
jgi:DNA invertase Pin-like site-specific DNA recombinase